jgi:hypothetical protein
VHASVPYAHAQHALKEPFQTWNFYAYDEHTRKKLMRMLRVRISSWLVCSANASVPDPYAQGMHPFLMSMLRIFWRDFDMRTLVPDAYALCMHQFLTLMLSVRIISWRTCSVQASVSEVHAKCTHQFCMRMLRVYKMKNRKTDAHAEHARKELMHMPRVRISSWCPLSGCTSVRDPYAQRAHKGWCMHVRDSIFSIILKVPKPSKNFKNRYWY